MNSIRVFISYSHDSVEHKQGLLALSDRLRAEGVDCTIDQYEQSPAEGWPRWCERQVEEASFVLVACTEAYLRRFKGLEVAGKGLGGTWEGHIITQELYNAQGKNFKFVPITLRGEDAGFVPLILQGVAAYQLDRDYENLYRRLTGQPAILKPVLGGVVPMAPRMAPQPALHRMGDFETPSGEHLDTATSLIKLASIYHEKEMYPDAESFYRRALAILEKTVGREHPEVARTKGELASVLHAEEKYDEAEATYELALERIEETLGPESHEMARCVYGLSLLYEDLGRGREADSLRERYLAMRERTVGSDDPELASMLSNWATGLQVLYGRHEAAEKLYLRGLAIKLKTLGPDHLEVAESYISVANCYLSQKKFAMAEPLFLHALAIREKCLGLYDPVVGVTLENLARFYGEDGNHEEAEKLFYEAQKIWKGVGRDQGWR